MQVIIPYIFTTSMFHTNRYATHFGNTLLDKVEERFPGCGTENELNCYANYLDPAFKGVHLDALGALSETKEKMRIRWGEGDERELDMVAGSSAELAGAAMDPTANLLQARRRSANQSLSGSKIQKEMLTYEALDELSSNGDRLQWWKQHEEMIPILAKAAKEILGIPCSSAKSERVFSTGGQVVTAKRVRLNPKKVEQLVVLKENRSKVELFKESTNYSLEDSTNVFASIETDIIDQETDIGDDGDLSEAFGIDDDEEPLERYFSDSSEEDD